MKISARLKEWPKEQPSIEIEYPMPATLQELVAQFGEDVIYNKAVDSITIDVQSNMRRMVKSKNEADRTPEAIQAKLATYKPSAVTRVVRSPAEKVQDLVGALSAEEKKALIKQLREAA